MKYTKPSFEYAGRYQGVKLDRRYNYTNTVEGIVEKLMADEETVFRAEKHLRGFYEKIGGANIAQNLDVRDMLREEIQKYIDRDPKGKMTPYEATQKLFNSEVFRSAPERDIEWKWNKVIKGNAETFKELRRRAGWQMKQKEEYLQYESTNRYKYYAPNGTVIVIIIPDSPHGDITMFYEDQLLEAQYQKKIGAF
jgi:hypothetical protein